MRMTTMVLLALGIGLAAGWIGREQTLLAPADQLVVSVIEADPQRQDSVAGSHETDTKGALDTSADEADPEPPPGPTRGPVLEGNVAAQMFATRLRAAYRKHSDGNAIPADLLRHYEAQYRNMLAWQPEGYARTAWKRDQLRRRVGMLTNPATVLLQARSPRRVDVPMASERPVRHLQTEPILIEPGPFQKSQVYVRGGLIPFGHALIVERIETSGAMVPNYHRRRRNRRGSVSLKVGNSKVQLPGGGTFSTTHVGRAIVRTGQERNVQLQIEGGGAVACQLEGKLVALPEARGLRDTPFVLTAFTGEGFLTGEQVVLQVVADHGGGNPRTMYLDGTANHRVDEMSDTDLWDDAFDPGKSKGSRGHSRGGGLVPPGKWFEVTEILYRARLEPKESHSDLVIRVARKELVDVNGKQDPTPSSTWTGSVIIRPGQERSFSVTASYHGLVEAVIRGRLIDPTEGPR